LEFRWLRLAQEAHETGGALGYESGVPAPLHDKPAVYPTEYARRAGELIARSARSLHRFRHMNSPGRESHRPKPRNRKASAYRDIRTGDAYNAT
jgi:hypothetical protein